MKLNRQNLDIAKLAPEYDESRYSLGCVLVTPTVTVETDGHQLSMVTLPPQGSPEVRNCVIPKSVALELAGAQPLLRHGQIEILVTEKGDEVTCRTSGGEVIREWSGNGKPNFPDYLKVIPAKDRAKVTLYVNPRLLSQVLKRVAEFIGDDGDTQGVCLRTEGPEQPIRIDAHNLETDQYMTAVVMPMRHEGEDL